MQIDAYLIEAHIFRKINNDIEFLLLKRSPDEKYPNIWQMVTGSIDDDEKAYETALREIKEETGLVPEHFWVVPHTNSFYSPEKNCFCLVPVFAVLVDPNSEVVLSAEHDEYRWVKMEEAKKLLAWQGQRQSVEIIYEYFTKKESLLNFTRIDLDKIKKND